MKKALLLCLLVLLPFAAKAQGDFVKPEVDIHFHGAMVNNEFDASEEILAPSLTIAAVRFAPYLGLRFGEHGEHRLKGGVNVTRDFGTTGDPLSTEMALWYQLNRKVFTLAAGIYPRSLMRGRYSTAILSDKVRYYDALMDGFLLQWKKGRSFYEIALDWNGKQGPGRREQFNVITAADARLTPWLSISWEGMLHHYASSVEVHGVVDDILFHPYLTVDLSSYTSLERLSLEAGAMLGYHNDRLPEVLKTPVGADVALELRKWGVGLRNEAYYGGSQCPFFHTADAAGNVYATDLYMRNSLWQITPDGSNGFYDKADLYWTPRVGRNVRLRLCWTAHFGHGGFLGHQQILEAIVDLENLCHPHHKKH